MTKSSSHELTSGDILAEVTRHGVVESQHSGHLIVLDSKGEVAFSKGDPATLIYPRSSIKSIQAAAMVRAGLKLEPRLLALVCASHSGSEMHQSAALEILAKAGLDESALRNGKDRPLGSEENRSWGNNLPTRLAHNCSGKHAGMVITSALNGWSLENYLDPEHPLQVACREELENLAEEKVALTTTDGCGAPLFLISLRGVAKAIHKITVSEDPIYQGIVHACRSFPEMVAGENRSTTRLMQRVDGLFLKEGAEGVEVGSLSDGRTFAFKISDGSSRAHEPIVGAILTSLGIEGNFAPLPIYGGQDTVGSISADALIDQISHK
jgi:L-asparaginase II